MTALKKQPEGGWIPDFRVIKGTFSRFFPRSLPNPPLPLLLHHPRTPEGGGGSPTFAL